MSRQIQIRRGTTSEHELFIGAIGEITMDTDTKTLRVHDGQTPGGIQLARADQIIDEPSLPDNYDFIIETKVTEKGWYRRYKSGWLEQGGVMNTTSSATGTEMTFQIKFRDIKYNMFLSASFATASTSILSTREVMNERTNSGAKIVGLANNNPVAIAINWQASGYEMI